ncbi:MAG: glycosyltransferase family 2 protein [Oscillospiraceae bacterium]|nr:glycosyltransferase family 2 protein [Oscillospiraceae bacterium]
MISAKEGRPVRDNAENIAVSVVIPVYGVEKYLPACLDSVLSQTLSEIEIICIDDHSPDRCPEILDEYAETDKRITVIHEPENRQQGYCRNRGIDAAKGKYIYLLDSDDMITPSAMEELYRFAEEKELDGVFFDSQVIFDSPELAKKNASYPAKRKGNYPDNPVTGLELFESFIEQGEWTCYIQRQFWNRDFLNREAVRFPEGVEHEDEVFSFEAILAAKKTMCISKEYFIRRYREDSVMTKPPAPRNFYGYFMDYFYMIETVRKRDIRSEAAESNIGRLYEKLVRLYALFRDREDLASWFRTEQSRDLFAFFEYSQRGNAYYRSFASHVLSAVPKERGIYIYGAGIIARNLWHGLTQAGRIVKGFIVTERKNNPPALFGVPVCTVSEMKKDALKNGDIAVIAVSRGYADEIEKELDKREIEHIYYSE